MKMLMIICLLWAVNVSAQEKSVAVNCPHEESNITVWDNPALPLAKEVGFTLKCGETVVVLGNPSPGSLIKIRTDNGKEGYVAGWALGVFDSKMQKFEYSKVQKQNKKVQKACAKHPEWSHDTCLLVSQHRVAVGMDAEMIQTSIGTPCHVNTTYREGHRDEQLVYINFEGDNSCLFQPLGWHGFNGYVYLENGVVTSIQTEY
jgi:hypothetical protein